MESGTACDAEAHELTWEQFACQASVKRIVFGGRRWRVELPRRLVYFSSIGVSNAEDALRAAHRSAVAGALSADSGIGWQGERPPMPPHAVLAQYPDLVPQ